MSWLGWFPGSPGRQEGVLARLVPGGPLEAGRCLELLLRGGGMLLLGRGLLLRGGEMLLLQAS